MDGAAYHSEQLMIQHDLERVIAKATQEPITDDEAKLLAWAAGIQLNQENATWQR